MRFKVFRLGLLKVAIAGMLGTTLVMPFAASGRLVQERRSEQGAASAPVTESAMLFEDESSSDPAKAAGQTEPAPAMNDIFPAFSKLGTIVAAVLLLLPFGLSTLRILRRNRSA